VAEKPLKVCFIGSSHLAAAVLTSLLKNQTTSGIELVGVVGRRSSKHSDDFVDILPLCGSAHDSIRKVYWEIPRETATVVEFLSSLDCDLGLCFGWNWLLPESILKLPRFGFIGYHPTLLPSNRGRHPIIWTIQLGLRVTGSTLFRLTSQPDDGPILSQQSVSLGPRETAQSLYLKLISIVPNQLEEVITLKRFQPEYLGLLVDNPPSSWRRRSKSEGVIDWRISAGQIDAIIRSLVWPYSGAQVWEPKAQSHAPILESIPVKLPKGTDGSEPGRILRVERNRLLIACGDSSALWACEHGLRRDYEIGDSLV
jgi:methionyl-tRNA formyltransferase